MRRQRPLETERLRLRPVRETDTDELWALWTHPDVRRYLWDDEVIPRERAAETVCMTIFHSDRGLGLWMLDERGGAEAVGVAGLLPVGAAAEFDVRLAGGVEPLVALNRAVWGRGYAAEALRGLVDYAFHELELSALVAAVDVPNVASIRLVERLGFTLLGESVGPRNRIRSFRRPGIPHEIAAGGE